ncbi:MAG: NAD(P)-dependent alcohol dehydrogenase [Verrucomicrobia bacterium]|nr:NAD(P)-dependent alcohol dehydrogenase [Verrucomicrobiota bacterium]
MTIHAWAAYGPKEPLKPFEYPLPPLGSHDVEIAISHCGICYSDLHLIDDDWGISRFPLVPGHEIIGTLTRKGPDVKNLRIGQKVGLGWQSDACADCEWCMKGEETLCSSKVRTCVDRHGGFADKMVVSSHFVQAIPDKMDAAIAAPLLCAGITVYTPFKTYGIQAPMSVAVIGIGGLGHLALQFAKAFGCEVTAISSSASKAAEARRLGADHFLSHDSLAEAKSRFDFVLSSAHADLDWSAILQTLRPKGRLCFVGLPKSPLQFPARLLVSGSRTVCGSGTGSRALLQEMLQFSLRHDIRPQVELFSMQDVNKAIQRLRSNQARYRLVLTN